MAPKSLSTRVLGIDRKRIELCPSDEHAYFNRIAIQMLVTGAFIFMMAFSGISVALGGGHWSNSMIAGALAALVAAQLVMIDIGIIDSAHIARAEAALGSPGGGDDDGNGKRWRRLLPRLAAAVLLSATFGIFGDLFIFRAEIGHQLDRQHAQVNAILLNEKRGIVLREIAEARGQVEMLVKESAQLLADAKALEEAGSGELTATANEIASIDARVKALVETKSRLGDERGLAIQNRDMEGQGVEIEGRTSGKEGCGKLCKRWKSEVERLDNAIIAADEEMQGLKGRRSALEELRKQLAEKATAGASKAVTEKLDARSAVEERLKEGRSRVEALEKAETATVQERVLADPRYVKREEGLAARFVALKEVAREYPSTAFVMFLISAAIMAVELGTVLSVEFGGRQTRYFLETVMAYRQMLHVMLRRSDGYRGGFKDPPSKKAAEAEMPPMPGGQKAPPEQQQTEEPVDIDSLFERFSAGFSDGDVRKSKPRTEGNSEKSDPVELKPNGAARPSSRKPTKKGFDVIT